MSRSVSRMSFSARACSAGVTPGVPHRLTGAGGSYFTGTHTGPEFGGVLFPPPPVAPTLLPPPPLVLLPRVWVPLVVARPGVVDEGADVACGPPAVDDADAAFPSSVVDDAF